MGGHPQTMYTLCVVQCTMSYFVPPMNNPTRLYICCVLWLYNCANLQSSVPLLQWNVSWSPIKWLVLLQTVLINGLLHTTHLQIFKVVHTYRIHICNEMYHEVLSLLQTVPIIICCISGIEHHTAIGCAHCGNYNSHQFWVWTSLCISNSVLVLN